MSLVFLTGMPASGKSHWGKAFAQYYDMGFVDVDEYIVEKEKKTITQFFEEEGEQSFREVETRYLKAIIESYKNENVLIATGGGVVLSQANRKLLKENGCVVYLETPLEVLKERIVNSINERPLLAKLEDVDELLKVLYDKRKPLYKEADYIFEYKKISVINFGQILKKCTDRHL